METNIVNSTEDVVRLMKRRAAVVESKFITLLGLRKNNNYDFK